MQHTKNLVIEVFQILNDMFFNTEGGPIKFELREKENTQDDPFDEYVSKMISEKLNDATCMKSPGALINPDMAVYRKEYIDKIDSYNFTDMLDTIIGVEVKKLERNNGNISRKSGLDYNSTPPCGTIQIYNKEDKAINITSFYLFVCLEKDSSDGMYYVSAFTLTDGNFINEDFNLYLSIVGTRTKKIGLGSYGDGINRDRPMFVFANPLGISELDKHATLIVRKEMEEKFDELIKIYEIERTTNDNNSRIFNAYRVQGKGKDNQSIKRIKDPLNIPKKRSTKTQKRGKFKLE